MLIDRKIWAVASGKGGVGKTSLAASMAVHLADLGFRVMLVDVDLSCANLHTLFGIERPHLTLSDFIDRNSERIDEVAIDTSVENLRLVAGAPDPMKVSHIRYQQKKRVIRQLNTVADDVVILDIATGASLTEVEMFRAAELCAVMVLPEPASVENAFKLLRMFYFHRVREIPGWKKFERTIPENLMDGSVPPVQFLAEVESMGPKWGKLIRKRMESFSPGIVVNQVREKKDRELGNELSLVCKRYFGHPMPFLGAVEFDECVYQASRHGKPVLLDYPHSRPSRSIRQITENMLTLSRRPE